SPPRIALISAVPAAVTPAVSAIQNHFEQPTIWNIIDDRLLPDASETGSVEETLVNRMRGLIQYAEAGDADAVLLTCSLYGAVAEQYHSSIPILSPDGPMIEEILADSASSVLIVASLKSALNEAKSKLQAAANEASIDIKGIVVPEALELAGDLP